MMRNKKVLRILGIIFGCIVIVATAALLFWNVNYKPADETARQALQSDSLVQVAMAENGDTDFIGPDTAPQDTYGLVFYPGANVDQQAYAPLLHQLAAKGWVCVTVKMPFNMAILDNSAAERVFSQYPQVEHWYIGGHSMGGSAAAMYAKSHSDKIDGLVLLASYSTENLTDKSIKALSSVGSNDGVINWENLEKNAKNLPAQTASQTIEGGNHAQYGSYGPQSGDNEATISAEDQVKQTVEFINQAKESKN